jgi:hypothetical protein
MGEQGSSLSSTALLDSPPNYAEFIVEKVCTKCKEVKVHEDFPVDHSKANGRRSICKLCANAQTKEWRLKNTEHRKAYEKQYNEINKELVREKNKRRYQNLTLDQKFEMLIKTAQKRNNFKCFISAEYLKQIWQEQEGRCAYTKLPLTADANQLNTMSLDRIDSSLDYVEGNVQLVCVSVNRMKSDFLEEEFIRLCNLITQNNKAPDYPTELAHIS